jgi:hypothetical protein
MPKGVPNIDRNNRAAWEAAQARRHGATGQQVVELARKYTTKAIQKIADLMDGKGGECTVLDKEGNVVVVQIEVPAAVQLRCAEVLLERGYGKAPQAIILRDDGMLPISQRALTVAEKIIALQEARENGVTLDLEASQQSEALTIDVRTQPVPTAPAKETPVEDLI